MGIELLTILTDVLNDLQRFGLRALIALVVFLILCTPLPILQSSLRRFLNRISKNGGGIVRLQHSLRQTIIRIATWLLIVLSVAVAARFAGFGGSEIIGLLGVLSLALALGSEGLVANLIGGFWVMSHLEHFHVGHRIKVGNDQGIVREDSIGLLTTKLYQPNGVELLIQNRAFLDDRGIEVSGEQMALIYELDCNPDQIDPLRAVLETLDAENPHTLKDGFAFKLKPDTPITGSGVAYLFISNVQCEDYWKAHDWYSEDSISERIYAAGLSLSISDHNVWIHNPA